MSNFFNPTTSRTQPIRQEGVVDTLRDFTIEGYSFENSTAFANAVISFGAAPAAATAVYTVAATVNPAYLAFSGQNVRNFSVSLVAGDTQAVQVAKTRAALSSDLLFSAYFNLSAAGGTILITPKQIYEPQAYLAGLGGSLPASYSFGAPPTALPLASVGRLVYTPASAPVGSSLVRTIEAGATGVLRGITTWCPDVEYNDILKATVLRPFYRYDVLSSGVINLDGVNQVSTYATQLNNLFVYTVGVNAGRIRVGVDAGAVALTTANFPALTNLGVCNFSVYELSFTGSSLYKLAVEIN